MRFYINLETLCIYTNFFILRLCVLQQLHIFSYMRVVLIFRFFNLSSVRNVISRSRSGSIARRTGGDRPKLLCPSLWNSSFLRNGTYALGRGVRGARRQPWARPCRLMIVALMTTLHTHVRAHRVTISPSNSRSRRTSHRGSRCFALPAVNDKCVLLIRRARAHTRALRASQNMRTVSHWWTGPTGEFRPRDFFSSELQRAFPCLVRMFTDSPSTRILDVLN